MNRACVFMTPCYYHNCSIKIPYLWKSNPSLDSIVLGIRSNIYGFVSIVTMLAKSGTTELFSALHDALAKFLHVPPLIQSHFTITYIFQWHNWQQLKPQILTSLLRHIFLVVIFVSKEICTLQSSKKTKREMKFANCM